MIYEITLSCDAKIDGKTCGYRGGFETASAAGARRMARYHMWGAYKLKGRILDVCPICYCAMGHTDVKVLKCVLRDRDKDYVETDVAKRKQKTVTVEGDRT